MHPIIRRHRQQLLPSDRPEAAPPPSSPVAAEVTRLKPPSTIRSKQSAEVLRPPGTANRSDSGQFWSDSSLPQASTLDPQPSAEVPPLPSGNSQTSTLNPQPLWSRQPDEPAADYQLFAAWLQRPAPRPLTKSAVALDCSLHRLRRLAVRYHWRTRAAAFDNHRADAASAALDQLLRDEALDWQERAHRFRLQEWLLHKQMMEAARAAVREFRKHPGRASLTELVRLIELGSVLGRRASGMPAGDTPAPVPEPLHRLDFEAALQKIYGQKADNPRQLAASPGMAAAPVPLTLDKDTIHE